MLPASCMPISGARSASRATRICMRPSGTTAPGGSVRIALRVEALPLRATERNLRAAVIAAPDLAAERNRRADKLTAHIDLARGMRRQAGRIDRRIDRTARHARRRDLAVALHAQREIVPRSVQAAFNRERSRKIGRERGKICESCAPGKIEGAPGRSAVRRELQPLAVDRRAIDGDVAAGHTPGESERRILADQRRRHRLAAGDIERAVERDLRRAALLLRELGDHSTMAFDRHAAQCRKRREIREAHRCRRAHFAAELRRACHADQRMGDGESERQRRSIENRLGLKRDRRSGEKIGLRPRHAHPLDHAVHIDLAAIALEIGGDAADARARSGKIGDGQLPGRVGTGERPMHMQIETRRSPMEIGARRHRRRGNREIEIDALAFEIDRAFAVAGESAGFHRETEPFGIARAGERGRDRHRAEIGQACEAPPKAHARAR